jgi:hypothetical protein
MSKYHAVATLLLVIQAFEIVMLCCFMITACQFEAVISACSGSRDCLTL